MSEGQIKSLEGKIRRLEETITILGKMDKERNLALTDLQRELLIAKQQTCPALKVAQEKIAELEERLQEHKEYERNSLLRGQPNATNSTMPAGSGKQS